uniref:THAP-type domain-containing protein n=1 Tax=Callorhinchus milii TaxID=7868 RepID=A0A4W3K9W0_CALMI
FFKWTLNIFNLCSEHFTADCFRKNCNNKIVEENLSLSYSQNLYQSSHVICLNQHHHMQKRILQLEEQNEKLKKKLKFLQYKPCCQEQQLERMKKLLQELNV